MANQKAEERLRVYQKVVEALDEIIVVIDRDYRYVLANQAFLDYRGVERNQVVGHEIAEVWGADTFREIKEKLDQAFRGTSLRRERKFTFPRHGERHISVFYLPLEGRNGIDRVACIVEDVTELRQAERDREKLFEALLASNEQLQMLSNRLVEVHEEERRHLADELHDQIRRTLTELMLQSEIDQRQVSKSTRPAKDEEQRLSTREEEVLRLIARGQRNRAIAELLGLSVRTVERYRSSIMTKLGLHNSTELIIFAVTHGFLGEESTL